MCYRCILYYTVVYVDIKLKVSLLLLYKNIQVVKGKQASKIESTSLCCISYTVLHVRDQKNEWSVFVE